MAVCFFFVCGAFILAGIIKLLLAAYAPKAYEAWMAEESRRRERRNSVVKSGLGLAFKFFGK